MRNDAIERSINDSMFTIADYILQMIEQAKKQKDLDLKMLMDQELRKLQQAHSSLSSEEKSEAEYELYYALIKERSPDLFELKGSVIETFPVDKDSSVFRIYQDNDKYFGVYKQGSKEAHKITEVFPSKEEVLQSIFRTPKFEKFRNKSFFLMEDGKAFSLQENKHFRLNSLKNFEMLTTHEDIKSLRIAAVKEELQNDPKIRKQTFRKVLEEYHIPADLQGKSITLNNISNEEGGVRVSIEDNGKERDIKLPDISQNWIERVKENPKIRAAFDEILMDSRSIAEGFLAFYGVEINRELQTKQHDFELITNEEGSYIGKFTGNGTVKKLSPCFSEKEAEKHLVDLKKHIQTENEKQRNYKEVEPSIEFFEVSEKN